MEFASKTRYAKPVQRAKPSRVAPSRSVNRDSQAEISRVLRSVGAQAKLSIGQPNDKYEQEADAVADKVMRMSDADVVQRVESGTVQPMRIQRTCEGCEEEMAQRQPMEEDEELQAKEVPGQTPTVAPNLESRINSLKGGGQPLDSATRSFFEPRFGHDFSKVRVHADSSSADIAKSINARAFALGDHVVMGSGEYQPRSQSGQHLLGHELTHVIQQGGGVIHPNAIMNMESRSRSLFSPDVSQYPNKGVERISRKSKNSETSHCGGAWTCSSGSPCLEPDNLSGGPFSTPVNGGDGQYKLNIMVDIDVDSFSDVRGGGDVGHTYVSFSDPSGARYSYGFYPQPSANLDGVMNQTSRGCMVHPDVTHDACTDYTETYSLAAEAYYSALSFVQQGCRGPHIYHLLNYNCTTWADAVARAAGKDLPNIQGHSYLVGDVDNPNTLYDSLRERDRATELAPE